MNISELLHNNVRYVLRIEGLVVFVSALFTYTYFQGSWLLFGLLFLIPDISMIGYFINKRVGSYIYNSVHNYILAGTLIFIGHITSNFMFFTIGLILTAHIGLDRAFGFGLKYQKDFHETHLQKV